MPARFPAAPSPEPSAPPPARPCSIQRSCPATPRRPEAFILPGVSAQDNGAIQSRRVTSSPGIGRPGSAYFVFQVPFQLLPWRPSFHWKVGS